MELFVYSLSIGNLIALCVLGYMVQSMWETDSRLQDRMVDSILGLRERVTELEPKAPEAETDQLIGTLDSSDTWEQPAQIG